MSRTHDAATLAALLSAEAHDTNADREAPAPHIVAEDALALMRIGATVKRWAVRACNGEGRYLPNATGRFGWVWDETDNAAKDKADARNLKKATEIAARYGATVEIGGDPRGYTLRLHLASGRKNSWGEGWGVM